MEENAYERYLDGDDSVLMDIIRAYKDGLTMYLNNYDHDLNIADDLCCETFVRLAEKSPTFGQVLHSRHSYTVSAEMSPLCT